MNAADSRSISVNVNRPVRLAAAAEGYCPESSGTGVDSQAIVAQASINVPLERIAWTRTSEAVVQTLTEGAVAEIERDFLDPSLDAHPLQHPVALA